MDVDWWHELQVTGTCIAEVDAKSYKNKSDSLESENGPEIREHFPQEFMVLKLSLYFQVSSKHHEGLMWIKMDDTAPHAFRRRYFVIGSEVDKKYLVVLTKQSPQHSVR